MKQETLEEAAANLADPNICKTENWIAGAKWMQERMYSEEEMLNFVDWIADEEYKRYSNGWGRLWMKGVKTTKELFEQFKKEIK